MTSLKQIEANRHNALKNTWPRTEAGKRRSRRNALRHGLTAATVIDGLEDSREYRRFQLAITSEFDAQTAVERELVLRLANLLWRLRRAAAIETGLFEGGADGTEHNSSEIHPQETTLISLVEVVTKTAPDAGFGRIATGKLRDRDGTGHLQRPKANALIANCFQLISESNERVFENLNRYELSLWRQTCQVLVMLSILQRHGLRGADLSRWSGFRRHL